MPDISKPQAAQPDSRGLRYQQALVWREIRRLARSRDQAAERRDCRRSVPEGAGRAERSDGSRSPTVKWVAGENDPLQALQEGGAGP